MFQAFVYIVISPITDAKGFIKIGLTIHPVHRMRQYNIGDPPDEEFVKQYHGLWLTKAKTRSELREMERKIHEKFEEVRMKRANGNFSEWFKIAKEEVAKFIDDQDFIIKRIPDNEISEIHTKASLSPTNDDEASIKEEIELMEEQNLLLESKNSYPKSEKKEVVECLREKFFRIFLSGRTPRRIQNELWDKMNHICNDDQLLELMFSGIVKWPTGVGKTIAMLMIFVLVKERSVRLGQIYRGLLVTRRNDIFNTISSEFHKLSEFGITLYDGSNGRLSKLTIPSNKPLIVMACPDSLRNEETGMRSLPHISHVHYDEVHRITGKLYFELLKEMLVKWNTKFLTGTSATPKTSDPEQHNKLAELFGDPYRTIHECDVDEAVREGWIAVPRFVVKITPKVEENSEGAYSKALAIAVQSTICMKKQQGRWNGGKCIAYARSVPSTRAAYEEFKRIMPNADAYLAIDGERTDSEFVNSPADGHVRVLFACERYREGSDIKGLEITCVLIGNAISAYILIQIQGRSLRMDYVGKEGWCLIVCPCEGDETEEEVLERIALDILTFIGDSRPLKKKDFERYVDTYFGEVSVNGTVFSKEETIKRIQAAYVRKEYAKRTPKEKYETVRALNKEIGLSSKHEYFEKASEHMKFIEKPEEYFKDWWVSWYHFLGVNTSAFPQTKSDWISVCKDMGLTSWDAYKQKNSPLLPANPGEMYEDYTNWNKELGVEEEVVW